MDTAWHLGPRLEFARELFRADVGHRSQSPPEVDRVTAVHVDLEPEIHVDISSVELTVLIDDLGSGVRRRAATLIAVLRGSVDVLHGLLQQKLLELEAQLGGGHIVRVHRANNQPGDLYLVWGLGEWHGQPFCCNLFVGVHARDTRVKSSRARLFIMALFMAFCQ